MDSYESMSNCHTSILVFEYSLRRGPAAFSPLSTLRTAIMRWDRPSLRNVRAHSKPIPMLLPVIIAVWPTREVDDGSGVGFARNWELMKSLRGEPCIGSRSLEDMVVECSEDMWRE